MSTSYDVFAEATFCGQPQESSQPTPPPSDAMSPYVPFDDDLTLLPPRVDRENCIACDACYKAKRAVSFHQDKLIQCARAKIYRPSEKYPCDGCVKKGRPCTFARKLLPTAKVAKKRRAEDTEVARGKRRRRDIREALVEFEVSVRDWGCQTDDVPVVERVTEPLPSIVTEHLELPSFRELMRGVEIAWMVEETPQGSRNERLQSGRAEHSFGWEYGPARDDCMNLGRWR